MTEELLTVVDCRGSRLVITLSMTRIAGSLPTPRKNNVELARYRGRVGFWDELLKENRTGNFGQCHPFISCLEKAVAPKIVYCMNNSVLVSPATHPIMHPCLLRILIR